MSPLSITGTTKFYALIGHPVEQVRTPTVLHAHLTEHGIDAVMVTFNLLPSSLEDFFKMMIGLSLSVVIVMLIHGFSGFANM